jgi:hypothetical protein
LREQTRPDLRLRLMTASDAPPQSSQAGSLSDPAIPGQDSGKNWRWERAVGENLWNGNEPEGAGR